MRLFVALDIAEEIRERIRRFMDQFRNLAPDARWVSPESLHVTLKFIGEKPDATVKDIEHALHSTSEKRFQVSLGGSGFFPSDKSARVFWIGIQADPALAALVAKIEGALVPLGVAAEERAFSPHLTLARAGGGSGAPGWRRGDKPNRQFARLQETLRTMGKPEFGSVTATDFYLYRSQLSSRGAQYTKIAQFPLEERN